MLWTEGYCFTASSLSLPAYKCWIPQVFQKLCSAPSAAGTVYKQHDREFVTSSHAWTPACWDLWILCRYVNKTGDNLTPLLFNLKRNRWGGGSYKTDWSSGLWSKSKSAHTGIDQQHSFFLNSLCEYMNAALKVPVVPELWYFRSFVVSWNTGLLAHPVRWSL